MNSTQFESNTSLVWMTFFCSIYRYTEVKFHRERTQPRENFVRFFFQRKIKKNKTFFNIPFFIQKSLTKE
jgi:hypothetical protein